MRLMLPFLVIAYIAHFYPHPIVPICLENEVLRRQKYMQIEYENKICVSGIPKTKVRGDVCSISCKRLWALSIKSWR